MGYIASFLLLILLSFNSFAFRVVSMVGNTEDGKECGLKFRDIKETDEIPAVMARVFSESNKGVSIELSRFWFDEQVERHYQGDLESVEFKKGGMSELCDYWDFCLFQKPLKTISIYYGNGGWPNRYAYTSIKNWKKNAEVRYHIKCENLIRK